MSPGHIFPGRMLLWQFASVKVGPRNLFLKFGQIQVSNSWDIPDLDKSYCDSWHLLKMVPRTYFWSLVKFRSATAETNVARTNNTWINVTMTVWISSRWSNEFTFKVRSKSGQYQSVKDGPRNQLLKFGQIQVSNSWDITDMDKCRQDKCCLDKCRHDSWNQFKRVPGIYF